MALNTQLERRLSAIQQALLAHKAGSLGLPTAVAGSERETFLREYLQKVFPAHRRFSSGAIIDSAGSMSGQVDIAVEFGFTPSFPMPGTDDRLLLAESVAAVIEVKSDLSAQWSEIERSTKKVKALRRKLGAVVLVGDNAPSEFIPLIAVGYEGHSTREGLAERLSSTPEDCRPDAALVIRSGSYVGLGVTASDSLGLYALAICLDTLLRSVLFSRSDLTAYAR